VLARLFDFFGHRTPWHRRLWNVSTVLALREVVEYADACLSKAVTSTQGLKYVVEAAKHQVDRDPGSAHLASEITARLDELSKSSSSKVPISARDELEQLVRRLKVDYLANWCEKAAPLTSVEFTARTLACTSSISDSAPIIFTAGSPTWHQALRTSANSLRRPKRW